MLARISAVFTVIMVKLKMATVDFVLKTSCQKLESFPKYLCVCSQRWSGQWSMPTQVPLCNYSFQSLYLGRALFTKSMSFSPSVYAADLDGDGRVGAADLGMLLSVWGQFDPKADLDFNGEVGAGDLSILLAKWET